MSFQPVSGLLDQYQKTGGTFASGFFLRFQAAGTSTDINMATDNTGGTLLSKCEVDTDGYFITALSARFVPHIDRSYKASLYPTEADADAKTNAVWTTPDLIPIGATNTTSNIFYAENFADFATAVTAAAGKELVISTNIVVAANITVADVTLRFIRGGNLDPNSGITVTLNTAIIAAVDHEIFDSTAAGTITGNFDVDRLYPDWFGAKNDGSTDDFADMTKALIVLKAMGGGNLHFNFGLGYPTSGKLDLDGMDNAVFSGDYSIIKNTSNSSGDKWTTIGTDTGATFPTNLKFTQLNFTGSGNATDQTGGNGTCIGFDTQTTGIVVDDCIFTTIDQALVNQGGTDITFTNNRVTNWRQTCVSLPGCRKVLVGDNHIIVDDGLPTDDGIVCNANTSFDANNVIIRHNYLTKNSAATDSVLTQRAIYVNTSTANDAKNFLIDGNIIEGWDTTHANQRGAIAVLESSTGQLRGKITNNQIDGAPYGIFCDGALTGVFIEHNLIKNVGHDSIHFTDRLISGSIVGNDMQNAVEKGLHVVTKIQQSRVTGNFASVTGIGFDIPSIDRSSVDSNTAEACGGDGFEVGGWTEASFCNNKSLNNTGFGFDFLLTGNNSELVFDGNIGQDNTAGDVNGVITSTSVAMGKNYFGTQFNFGAVAFTNADATPSVSLDNGIYKTTGTTAITDFDGGRVGQTIRILATDAIAITESAAIILSAAYTMQDSDTLVLTMYDDQVWQEDSRSVN